MAKDSKLAWKAISTVVGIIAGMAAKKAVGAAWQRTTGNAPPVSAEHPDLALPAALTWAMAVGAVAAVVKACLTRQAASRWRGLTGALPPGLDELESI